METVGTILKEAREERGETISNAALHTKIGSRYLSALEDDRYESFPSETHITGFIRSYGKYLDLDPDHLIGIYKRIVLQESPTPLEELTAPHKQRFNPGFFFVIFLIIAIIAIPVYFLLDKSSQGTEIFQPDDEVIENSKTNTGQVYSRGDSIPIKIAGQTIPLIFETVTREGVVISLGGQFYEAILGKTAEFDFDADGLADVYLTIGKISGQDFEATITMGKLPDQEQAPLEEATDNKVILKSEERNEISLTISANGVSTINIQKDENLQEDYFLKKGEKVTISARDSLRLTASNPNNLNLNLNRVALAIDTKNPAVDFLFKWRLNPGDGLYHLEYEQLR